MIKKFYRKLHISPTLLRINNRYLLKKDTLSFIDLTKVKPNLIIIGSQKCGTTSLHNYLNEHPDIFMSYPLKEPGYFIFENWAKPYWSENNVIIKDQKEMLTKFMLKGYSGQKYFGESSTYYTQDKREQEYHIPEKIKQEVGNSKMIYIIRNPLDRLVSVYYHLKKFNNYDGTFEEMLKSDDSYLNTSLYFSRLENYLNVFDKKDILILKFEDLVECPQELMSNVYKFLELSNFNHVNFERFNKTSPKQKVKFPKLLFDQLIKPIENEKNMLEETYIFSLNWDLNRDNWIQ